MSREKLPLDLSHLKPSDFACNAVAGSDPLQWGAMTTIHRTLSLACPSLPDINEKRFITKLAKCQPAIKSAFGKAGEELIKNLQTLAHTLRVKALPTMPDVDFAVKFLSSMSSASEVRTSFALDPKFRQAIAALKAKMIESDLWFFSKLKIA